MWGLIAPATGTTQNFTKKIKFFFRIMSIKIKNAKGRVQKKKQRI